MTPLNISGDLVQAIARMIAWRDFRVTVSSYVTRSDAPWIITVGEQDWQRHLVVEGVGFEGDTLHATFAILAKEESERTGYDIGVRNVAKRMTLAQLGGYASMKNELRYGC